MFCKLWISKSFASFIYDHQAQIYSHTNDQKLKNTSVFWIRKIVFIMEKSTEFEEWCFWLIVVIVFNLHVCKIKASLVITIQKLRYTSLCGNLSKLNNFPLRQIYTVFWTRNKLIMHVSIGFRINFGKFLETLKNDYEKWNQQLVSFINQYINLFQQVCSVFENMAFQEETQWAKWNCWKNVVGAAHASLPCLSLLMLLFTCQWWWDEVRRASSQNIVLLSKHRAR